MIGARDMAFPRLNALSYWIFLASGIFVYSSLLIGQAPNAGWFDYVPLASAKFDPGHAVDFYCLGLIFNGIASSLTAANFIVTILKLRATGMSSNHCMPLFCFAFLAASFGLLFALPSLTADAIFLFLDRNVGTHFFDVAKGGSVLLWQHLFWIFGHPEVYILIVRRSGSRPRSSPRSRSGGSSRSRSWRSRSCSSSSSASASGRTTCSPRGCRR